MSSEHVLFIVKPEGLPYRDLIATTIEAAGLPIILRQPLVLTANLVMGLYPCLKGPLIDTTFWWLANKTCEVGLVVAPNAIVRLLELCGANPNPVLCGLNTIRRRYGNTEPLYLSYCGQKFEYYFNVVHCARTAEQAAHDLALLKPALAP